MRAGPRMRRAGRSGLADPARCGCAGEVPLRCDMHMDMDMDMDMGATCACVLQAVGWRAGDCAGARRPERRTARTRTAHKTQRDASRGGYAQRCGAMGGAFPGVGS